MFRQISSGTRAFCAIISLLCVAAIVLQLSMSLPGYAGRGRTLGGFLLEYFSYFTIQSNLLVALCTGFVALSGFNGKWFTRPGVLSAVAVYITIVSLVYNFVLRSTFHPVGWARVADELLHVVNPVLYLIFWAAISPKTGITYKGTFSWLIYPLFYIIYILVRGALTTKYPYFFLDAGKFGYPQVTLNVAVLVVVFWLFCMLYAFIAQRITVRKIKS